MTEIDTFTDALETEMATEAAQEIKKFARRWNVSGTTYWGAKDMVDTVPSGIYRPVVTEATGPALVKIKIETDNLIELDDSVSKRSVAEFREFWTLRERFRKYGFLHKRGLLFYGPPGGGKTCTVALMTKHLIDEYNGVALYVDHPGIASAGFQLLRHIEPDRPIIAIMEDVDALIHRYGESEYLAMLDGEAQVDNIVFAATTNYMENLDPRIKNRPSRFDQLYEVGYPSAAMRRAFFEQQIKDVEPAELDNWVALTADYSFAHMREFIVSVRCFGYTAEATNQRLRSMMENNITSSDYAKPEGHRGFGFRVG